jgi:hypothetical protein
MQGDGNLVIYSPNGAVWSSSTATSSGDRLVMQSDGNLVIYDGSGIQVRSVSCIATPERGAIAYTVGDRLPGLDRGDGHVSRV